MKNVCKSSIEYTTIKPIGQCILPGGGSGDERQKVWPCLLACLRQRQFDTGSFVRKSISTRMEYGGGKTDIVIIREI